MTNKVLSCVIVFSFLMSISVGAKGKIDSAKDRFANNIVPQPKIVELSKNSKFIKLSPDKITIVYGENSPKTKIGAEEIKTHIARQGFSSKVNIISDTYYQKGTERFLIIIGGPKENKISKLQWKNVEHAKELSGLKPEGYLIERVHVKGKPSAILAGVTPQGSLYAAITFMQILDKKEKDLIIPPVYIKDWPDFNWRYIAHMTTFFGQVQRAYKFANLAYIGDKEAGKEYINWALKFKINVVGIKVRQINKNMLSILAYGKARGIYPFIYYPRPSVSLGKVSKHKNDPRYKGVTHIWKREKSYISWSRDDLLEPLYREFAKSCKKIDAKFCWFHTVDTGMSTLNYANWKNRDRLDKKKFGNSLGLADAHIINLICKTFKKESSKTKIVYVTYPYTAAVLADDFPNNIFPDLSSAYAMKERRFIKNFFKDLRENMSKNAYTCLRETDRKSVERWLDATKRPIMAYFETSHRAGDNLCNSRPRFIKTFYSKRYDNIYFFPSIHLSFIHGIEIPVKILLNAEYCWNVNQRGAENFRKFNFSKDLTQPKVVFADIVPRICRAYWGKKAGKYFIPLFQAGIIPDFIENPDNFKRSLRRNFAKALNAAGNLTYSSGSEIFFIKTAVQMRKQHASLQKALPFLNEWMDNYKEKELDSFSYRYGTMLWLMANYWCYKSAVWAPLIELKEHMIKGNKDKSLSSLKQAEEALQNGKNKINIAIKKISGKHLCQMPYLKINGKRTILPKIMILEFRKIEIKLQELRTKVKQISSSLLINKKELTKLKNRQLIASETLDIASETLDKAKLYSNFTVYGSKPIHKAFQQTSVRVYYDSKNIYIKAKMFDAKGEKTITGRNLKNKGNFWANGKEENDLEIFIAPPKHKFIYQLAFDPIGQKFQLRLAGKPLKRDYAWKCNWQVITTIKKGYWTAYVTLPFSELGLKIPKKGQFWKFALARQQVNKNGATEFSTINPGVIPNKSRTYATLIFK